MSLKGLFSFLRKPKREVVSSPPEAEFVKVVEALLDGGDYEAALREIEKGISLCPESTRLLTAQGRALLSKQCMSEAEEAFRRSLRLDAAQLHAHLGMATIHERRREWEAALTDWETCLALFPSEPAAAKWRTKRANILLRLSRYDEAEHAFMELAAADKNSLRVLGYVGLARIAKRRTDWPLAVQRWHSCLESFPKHPEAAAWRGEELAPALAEAGRLADAAGEWRTCLKRFPGHEKVSAWRFRLAQALTRLRRFPEAEREFQVLLSAEPDHAGALAGMAHLAEKQGQLHVAVECYHGCITAFPDYPRQVRWRAALASLYLRQGDLDAAESQFQKLAEQYPRNPAGPDGLEQVFQLRQIGQA
jgi:hypothetical protein